MKRPAESDFNIPTGWGCICSRTVTLVNGVRMSSPKLHYYYNTSHHQPRRRTFATPLRRETFINCWFLLHSICDKVCICLRKQAHIDIVILTILSLFISYLLTFTRPVFVPYLLLSLTAQIIIEIDKLTTGCSVDANGIIVKSQGGK